jgi:mRNA interferase MazF
VVSRGEVWWVEAPEAGRRPHLVLTRDAAITALRRVLAVPAMRTVRCIPTEVVLDESDGMPQRCALSLDNLTVLPKVYFVERLCRLPGQRMVEVCAALGIATGCRR